MAFYFAESEKCHFHFPLKSKLAVQVIDLGAPNGRVDDFLRSHQLLQYITFLTRAE